PTEAELRGLPSQTAEQLLSEAGFAASAITEYPVAPDQSGPNRGIDVVQRAEYSADQTRIDLYVVGIRIPNLAEKPIKQVIDELVRAGLKTKIVEPSGERVDVNDEAWVVKSTDPKWEDYVKAGTQVSLTTWVNFPDVKIGTPIGEALNQLGKYFLDLQVSPADIDRNDPAWLTKSTNQSPHAVIPQSRQVILFAGRLVPKVKSSKLSAALGELAKARLGANIVQQAPGCQSEPVVSSQEPDPAGQDPA